MSFKKGLMEDGVSFKFFANDDRICEWTPDPR